MPKKNPIVNPELTQAVSVREAATALRVCPDTVKKGVREGRLPGTVIGTVYVIPRPAFQRFLAGDWQPKEQSA